MTNTTQTNQLSSEIASSQQVTWQDIETALVNVIKAGIYYRYPKDSKFIEEYKGYTIELRNAKDKEEHIKRIAYMIFPDEEAYNKRMGRYYFWYKNKPRILKAVETLYGLYHNLMKENILTEDKIEEE
ncbi:36586_t:CDS:1, partial [Gigaspora margarita]